MPVPYAAPELRVLGSVHELTQAPKTLGLGDAILFRNSGGGGGGPVKTS